MKKIVNLIIMLLLLNACSTDYSVSKDNVFENKKECSKLENEITEKVAASNESKRLLGIFFSFKRNSCLYSTYSFDDGGKIQIWKLYDFYTKEEVYFELGCTKKTCKKSPLEAEKDFNNRLLPRIKNKFILKRCLKTVNYRHIKSKKF